MLFEIGYETLRYYTLGWMALGVLTFFGLLKQTQPYGRHTTSGWGPMMSNQWGWVIQEAPSLLFLSVFFLNGSGPRPAAAWFLWGLWVLHYLNRSFIFPFRTRTKGKKIPVLIVLSAIGFNFMNGWLNGSWLGNFADFPDAAAYFSSLNFIAGFILFGAGAIINLYHDEILIHLRKPGETGYKIPVGGLFKYISCPNLFGEIIEWFGFAVMCGSLPAWSFALWAFCNLVPRARDHHRWYREKFAEYPAERKAVIPFVL
jgi:hypothetical protein